MQRGLGGTAFEPVPQSRDRELTLGPFVLTFIGCGLFALCGLCFVFGYAAGHRNAESASALAIPPAATPAAAQPATLQPKPSAGQNGSDAASAEPADSSEAETGTSSQPAANAQPANPADQPAVAQPVSAAVQPALAAQPAGVMVQIAAVSHPEDADVLVGALRKRGYAVTARRDPTDGLLHVQIGPFANRNDAWAMRQKLLNDGYNAIVQP
jgi:DedD protein